MGNKPECICFVMTAVFCVEASICIVTAAECELFEDELSLFLKHIL